MDWASILDFTLKHVLPVLVATGGGYLVGGRRAAATAAANAATDQGLDAMLKKIRGNAGQLKSEPFNDEPTKPGE